MSLYGMSDDGDAEEVADEFEALLEIYGDEGFERELVHEPVRVL